MKKTPKVSILLFLQAMGITKEIIFQSINYSEFLKFSFLDENHPFSISDALIRFYSKTHPKKDKTEITALLGQKFLFRKFLNPKTYDLGYLGRFRLNKKLGLSIPISQQILTPSDILYATDYLISLEYGLGSIDDIDHLKNRRVRASGELIQNQFATGLIRLEKMIREKMKKPKKTLSIRNLLTTKPINGALREFFGSSQLSQFMDQTNPLAEITHKRRLSSLGPGGISRETAGMAVRGIHSTHYGRICPIETPEGPNAGLVNSITTYARMNFQGFLETPFLQLYRGQIQKQKGPVFISAEKEEKFIIAPADLKISRLNFLPKSLIAIRRVNEFKRVSRQHIEYMALSPIQMISIATSLIPFLEHDDANRALMGSNMQRQAVPLMKPEQPIVGTGLEMRVASDSGHILQALKSGYVYYVSAQKISVIIKNPNGRKVSGRKVSFAGSEATAAFQNFTKFFPSRGSEVSLPFNNPLSKLLTHKKIQLLTFNFFLVSIGFCFLEIRNKKEINSSETHSNLKRYNYFFYFLNLNKNSLKGSKAVAKRMTQGKVNKAPIGFASLPLPVIYKNFIKYTKFYKKNKKFLFFNNFRLVFFVQKNKLKTNYFIKRLVCKKLLTNFVYNSFNLDFFVKFDKFDFRRKLSGTKLHSYELSESFARASSVSLASSALLCSNQFDIFLQNNQRKNFKLNVKKQNFQLKKLASLNCRKASFAAFHWVFQKNKTNRYRNFDFFSNFQGSVSFSKASTEFASLQLAQLDRAHKSLVAKLPVKQAQNKSQFFFNLGVKSGVAKQTSKISSAFVPTSLLLLPFNYVNKFKISFFSIFYKKLKFISNFNKETKFIKQFEKMLHYEFDLLPLELKSYYEACLDQSQQALKNVLGHKELAKDLVNNSSAREWFLSPSEAQLKEKKSIKFLAKRLSKMKKALQENSQTAAKPTLLPFNLNSRSKSIASPSKKNSLRYSGNQRKGNSSFANSSADFMTPDFMTGDMGVVDVVPPTSFATTSFLTTNKANTTKIEQSFYTRRSELLSKLLSIRKFEQNSSEAMNLACESSDIGSLEVNQLFKEADLGVSLVPTPFEIFDYNLQNFHRSNQDTCIKQKPIIFEKEWIQKNEILADGAASFKGELALGKNILIGYMPWEGYNFEDAILINEKLVYDDIYTSLHIERYEIEIRETKFGVEQITNQIPEVDFSAIAHLDLNGIAKMGSWVKEGDILVGKVTPIKKKYLTPHEKLLYDIVGKDIPITRDTSLRVPKGVQGRIVNVQILDAENIPPEVAFEGPGRVHIYLAEKRKIQVGDKMAGRHGNKGIVSKILPRQDMPYSSRWKRF